MATDILDLTTGSENRELDPKTGKMILMEYTPDEVETRRRFFKSSRQTNPTRHGGENPKHRVNLAKGYDSSWLR